jgi:hypothetical protein
MISQVREWPWEHLPTSVAPGYFCPVWPMLGWVFGLASHGLAAGPGESSATEQGPSLAAAP